MRERRWDLRDNTGSSDRQRHGKGRLLRMKYSLHSLRGARREDSGFWGARRSGEYDIVGRW